MKLNPRQNHHRSKPNCESSLRRFGFTLVELLTALVIGSTLLVATLGVLRTATKYNKLAKEDASIQPAIGRLAEQLEREFTNARAYRASNGVVEIAGFMGRSMPSNGAQLEPAIVSYFVKRIGEDFVLFRREMQPLAAVTPLTEPVLVHVSSFELQIEIENDEVEASESGLVFANGLRPMPELLQVLIRDSGGGVVLQKRIVHHSVEQ